MAGKMVRTSPSSRTPPVHEQTSAPWGRGTKSRVFSRQRESDCLRGDFAKRLRPTFSSWVRRGYYRRDALLLVPRERARRPPGLWSIDQSPLVGCPVSALQSVAEPESRGES